MESPGDDPPRMADVAERAGVSRMAVSAVLMGTGQGRIRVAEETAVRIRRVAEEMGYRPNAAARQLAGQRSGVIGFVAWNSANFLTQRLLAGLHAAAESHELRVMAAFARHSTEPVHRLLRDLKAGWLDGLVYLAHENEDQWPEVAELFQGARNAVVAVGDPGRPGVSAVVSDVEGAAKESVRHLAGRGRRRLVFVTEQVESAAIQARIAAYRQTCAECGIPFDGSSVVVETKGWIVSSKEFYPRFEALADELVSSRGADAVLCDTDFTAVGLVRAYRRLGRRVPEDVSVVGWGDLQFASVFDPQLTTVSLDSPDLLSRVVERLQRSSMEPVEPEIERVPMKLRVRESS